MSSADSTPILKTCNRCGREQPLSAFHKNKKNSDGHVAFCKSCKRIESAAYHAQHANEIQERVRAWRSENPDRCKENAARWVESNLEKSRAIKAAWREKNRSLENARSAERRKSDPSARRAASLKYYKANRERYRAYVRNRRAAMRRVDGSHTQDDVLRLYSYQRGRCAHCGTKLGDDYHVDHVVPISRGGSNSPGNLQLLCPTCNKSKGAKDPIVFAQQHGRLL